MGDMEYIELMIAIDAQTPENGCLELVPGSLRGKPTANDQQKA